MLKKRRPCQHAGGMKVLLHAEMVCLARAGQLLRLFNLIGGQRFGNKITHYFCLCMSINCSKVKPHMRFDLILRHAFTAVIHKAKHPLRFYITLHCRLGKPDSRLLSIFWYPIAVVIHNSKIILRFSDALISGFCVPKQRLFFVFL